MPTVQSTYGDMAAAVAGQIANLQDSKNVISRTVQTAVLPFGAIATQGTTDKTVRPAATGRTIFRGFAVRDRSTPIGATANQYAVGDTAAILDEGPIWVVVSGAVTAGAPAYWVEATGAITATSSGNLAIPNSIFDTSAADGALAIVRVSR